MADRPLPRGAAPLPVTTCPACLARQHAATDWDRFRWEIVGALRDLLRAYRWSKLAGAALPLLFYMAALMLLVAVLLAVIVCLAGLLVLPVLPRRRIGRHTRLWVRWAR